MRINTQYFTLMTIFNIGSYWYIYFILKPDNKWAYAVPFVITYFVYFIYLKFEQRKRLEPGEILIKTKAIEDAEVTSDNYKYLELKNLLRIFIESTYIIDTTKQIDTLVGRKDLLFRSSFKLEVESMNPYYMTRLQESIDRFKHVFYDKVLTDRQLKFLINPTASNFRLFCNYNLERCIHFNMEEMIHKIRDAKSKKSKLKRIDAAFAMIMTTRRNILAGNDSKIGDQIFDYTDKKMEILNSLAIE